MSELSKQINRFFESSTKKEAENLLENMLLSEHLKKVFSLKYLQNKDIDYIAYITGYSRAKINNDLARIRKKIAKAIDTRDN